MAEREKREQGLAEDEDIDQNYRSLKILVFRNGDEYDQGALVPVTRREFKHWIALLEHLTRKMKSSGPINHLYTMDGREVRHFKYLKDMQQYVAATGPFKNISYGRKQPRDWKLDRKFQLHDPTGLESSESLDIYLRKQGYVSKTGQSYYENARWEGLEFEIHRQKRRALSEKRAKKDHFTEAQKRGKTFFAGPLAKAKSDDELMTPAELEAEIRQRQIALLQKRGIMNDDEDEWNSPENDGRRHSEPLSPKEKRNSRQPAKPKKAEITKEKSESFERNDTAASALKNESTSSGSSGSPKSKPKKQMDTMKSSSKAQKKAKPPVPTGQGKKEEIPLKRRPSDKLRERETNAQQDDDEPIDDPEEFRRTMNNSGGNMTSSDNWRVDAESRSVALVKQSGEKDRKTYMPTHSTSAVRFCSYLRENITDMNQISGLQNSFASTSEKSTRSHDSGIEEDVHPNFRPIRVFIYRNGDAFDPGTEVSVTRREFKHWIAFLDFLTLKSKLPKSVNHLYDADGREVRHFRHLQDGGLYVVASGRFKRLAYGVKQVNVWNIGKSKPLPDPAGIDSAESLDIYLSNMGYLSKTNKPFYDSARNGGREFEVERTQCSLTELRKRNKATCMLHLPLIQTKTNSLCQTYNASVTDTSRTKSSYALDDSMHHTTTTTQQEMANNKQEKKARKKRSASLRVPSLSHHSLFSPEDEQPHQDLSVSNKEG